MKENNVGWKKYSCKVSRLTRLNKGSLNTTVDLPLYVTLIVLNTLSRLLLQVMDDWFMVL